MSCPIGVSASAGCCPFSSDKTQKVTPVLLGAHLAALNLVLIVVYVADLHFLSSSCNFLALSLLACLVAVQFKKYLGVTFKKCCAPNQEGESTQKSSSQCCVDFSNPESVKGLYIHLYTWINNAIQKVRKVVILQDKVYTLRVLITLYLITKFAHCLGDFGFIFLAANIACAYPYVKQNHSEQIKAIYGQLRAKVDPIVEQVLSKITAKPKTE